MTSKTIVLTGNDLTPERSGRGGPVRGQGRKSQAEARQRGADTYGLMLQGAAEGMPVYLFNRGAGSGRETALFTGDPHSAENKPVLEARPRASSRTARRGEGRARGERGRGGAGADRGPHQRPDLRGRPSRNCCRRWSTS